MTNIKAQRESLGNWSIEYSDAEGVEQLNRYIARLQRAVEFRPCSQRFSLGYNIGRRWRRISIFKNFKKSAKAVCRLI